MLFKTENPQTGGCFYCKLPRKFNFKKLTEDCKFSEEIKGRNTTFLFNFNIHENKDYSVTIPADSKYIMYEDEEGIHHIFFQSKAWLINKKGITVETL